MVLPSVHSRKTYAGWSPCRDDSHVYEGPRSCEEPLAAAVGGHSSEPHLHSQGAGARGEGEQSAPGRQLHGDLGVGQFEALDRRRLLRGAQGCVDAENGDGGGGGGGGGPLRGRQGGRRDPQL